MQRFFILTLALISLAIIGCSTVPANQPDPVKVWHVVIVRLKNPGDPDAQKKLLEAGNTLRQIKSVRVLYAGKAIKTDRAHVDNNYDVAFNIGFESAEDMAAYVKDPIHIKTAKEILMPLAQDYTVFDFYNESLPRKD